LEKDLRELQVKEDNLLICSPTQDISNANTILVLNFLAGRRYKVSKNKTRVSLWEVCILSYSLTPGAWRLSSERIEPICTLEAPLTKHQLHSFWGMSGFCWFWIPNFGNIAKSLYEITKGPDNEPLKWTREADCTCRTL
jgi:hypothetical protein